MKNITITKPLYGKFGIEPTFYPDMKIPAALKNNDDAIEELYDAYHDKVGNLLTKPNLRWGLHREVRFWMRSHEGCGGGGMEIPTPHQYTDPAMFYRDYKQLVRILKSKYGYLASSLVDMDTEGGCHINIDREKCDGETKFGKCFDYNLQAFLNTYPTLVWMNLSPNDNSSACICEEYNDSTNKGDMINDREDYYELRFFIMPRNEHEMMFHLEVANNLMWYVHEKTKEKVKFTFNNGRYELHKYTDKKKALAEAEDVLKLIGCDPARAKACGKFKILEERIELGRNYLQ